MAFSTFSSTSALILFSGLLFLHIRYWHTCSLTGRILSDQSSWKCVLFVFVIQFQMHCVNKHLEIGGFYCKGPEVQQRLLAVPLDDGGVGVEVGQSPQYNPAVIHVRQGLLASKLCWKLDKTILEYMIWRQKRILFALYLLGINSPWQGNHWEHPSVQKKVWVQGAPHRHLYSVSHQN